MRTQVLRPSILILALLGFVVIAGQHSVQALATPPQAASSQSHILVRILELQGTGPDGATHRLFSDTQGYTTTLNALGRIGSQVSGTGLADGAYHTLYVRLHDNYEALRPDGTRQSGRFSEQGKPTIIRVRGMVMVEHGKATALRMLENPNYYRNPNGFHGGEDDDD